MESKKNSLITLGLSLGIICAVASCVLAFTSVVTKEPIVKNLQEKENKALRQILPAFNNEPINEKLLFNCNGHEVVFYPAKENGTLVSIAAGTVTSKGFGGKLTVMLSISPDGKMSNVIVTQNNETPGLGTVVTDRKKMKTIVDILSGTKEENGLPANKVLDSFNGHNTAEAPWQVKKDGGTIDAVTGATISSRAVTDGVNTIAIAFNSNKNEILAKFAEKKD